MFILWPKNDKATCPQISHTKCFHSLKNSVFLSKCFLSWRRSHGNGGRRDDEPRRETESGGERRQRPRQRASQTKGTPLTFIFFPSHSAIPSRPLLFVFLVLFLFLDLALLMKQTRSDQHMLPQHNGLLLCCFLAIFNDLFNIYHS